MILITLHPQVGICKRDRMCVCVRVRTRAHALLKKLLNKNTCACFLNILIPTYIVFTYYIQITFTELTDIN